MAKRPRKTAVKATSGEVRVKLLQPDLKEGAVESIVRLPIARANELIASQAARLAHRDDFSFQR